jgi:ribosomal protein S4
MIKSNILQNNLLDNKQNVKVNKVFNNTDKSTKLGQKLSLKKIRLGKKRLKDYGKVLLAKQLLRALYNNPRERTFKKYFLDKKSVNGQSTPFRSQSTQKGSINGVFEKLNSRLDIVLTAMGGALSNKHAKQLINHGKITVNGHIVKEKGYLLKDGDIVASSVNFVHNTNENLLNTSRLSEHVEGRGSGLAVKSKFNNLESLKVASLKPKKIPSYLGLNTPVFANLFVNSTLNYGIYYSKPLNLTLTNLEESFTESSSKFQRTPSSKNSGLGWKNTNVKSIKTLLVDLKTALIEIDSIQSEKPSWTGSGLEGAGLRSSFSGNLNTIRTKEKIKTVYSILYSLVQAYYSRQH